MATHALSQYDEEEKEEEEKEEEEKHVDIKSNNPHLTGGEKNILIRIILYKENIYLL